jgi:hypothetical protein
MQFRFPQFPSTSISQLMANASPEAVHLIQVFFNRYVFFAFKNKNKQDLLLYDPQQRPTCSQTLQYAYFQVNNAMPAPLSTAEQLPSTFTRRPVVKTEAELKAEERALAKQVSNPLFLL